MWDCRVDLQSAKKGGVYVTWEQDIKKIGNFAYDPRVPYFDIVVPTKDVVRYQYLIRQCIHVHKPIFFTGMTGTGKSVIAKHTLEFMKNSYDEAKNAIN